MNSNNKKILFLIYSPLFTKGGHSKNFLNLIKHFEPEIRKNNYEAAILSYNNTAKDISNNKLNILDNTPLQTYKIKLLKRHLPAGKVVYKIMRYILHFFQTFYWLIFYHPKIVYAYSDSSLYLSFAFKRLLNFKLIYDMRGDAINELKVQGASNIYLKLSSYLNNLALKFVDLIFTVTSENKLGRGITSVAKYNYYDGETFLYSEKRAIEKKKEFKLEDKFVFVYTGNAHYYQFLEGTIKFYSQFQNKYPSSFFIIITEYESNKFVTLLNKYNIPATSYLITSLKQNEIADLQQIADMGFLLREDLPLNHNSFPTKFAEYLASGVPVLTTPHIHSIAPMILENNLGQVIEIKDDYSVVIPEIYRQYFHNLENKMHCSEFAKSELMWQKKASDIFNFINQF